MMIKKMKNMIKKSRIHRGRASLRLSLILLLPALLFLLLFWNTLYPRLCIGLENSAFRPFLNPLAHPDLPAASFVLTLCGHLLYCLYGFPYTPSEKPDLRMIPESLLCSGALFLVIYAAVLTLISLCIFVFVRALFSLFLKNPSAFSISFKPDGKLSTAAAQKGSFTARKG